MINRYLQVCLATVLPLGLTGNAFAQASAPAQPAAASPYELSGTSISGVSQSTSVILSAPVNADQSAYKTESGIYLYPSAFLGLGRNDNLLTTNTRQISSNFLRFYPKMVAELKKKGDRYTALASMDAVRYSNSSQDNVTNSEFQVAGDNYFSSRASAGWSLGRLDGSDARGSTDRAILLSPDLWHTNSINGRLIYGAQEATGRVELDLGRQDKTYENNRLTTVGSDKTVNSVAGRGYFRVGTRTLALLEVRQATADYDIANSPNSGTERKYYAGLTWEATAATTGIVKVGRMTKDFDLNGLENYSGGSWEAAVRWTPVSYSTFDLNTSRSTEDSTGYGNFTLNTGTTVAWNHRWTQSLSTRVGFGLLTTDYAGTNRSDRTKNYSLAADYAVLRWLKVGVDFARTDNSSNDARSAYVRNIGMFTLNASL